MKALHQLNDPEKAVLLHQLFPGEISGLIDFVSAMCLTIKEDEQRSRKSWNDPAMLL